MLTIETTGTWMEMGRQLGLRFGPELRRCVDRFMSFMPDNGKRPDVAARHRSRVRDLCPELLDETAGMAEGSGIPEERLFCYRFYPDISAMMQTGCSVFFARDEAGGSWLGRTCDIEQEDHWSQLLHIRRPSKGTATATTTYLGMAVSVGMNEHGVGLVGASAHAREPGNMDGIPQSLLSHQALHTCRTADEVHRLFTSTAVTGHDANYLAADAAGASCLYEVVQGRRMVAIPRPPGETWQAATNFYLSAESASAPAPNYLYNAYARYGRLVHRLAGNQVERKAAGLQRLLADVSQPGPYIPKGACPLETAYATLFDLGRRTVHFAHANPNETPFESITL